MCDQIATLDCIIVKYSHRLNKTRNFPNKSIVYSSASRVQVCVLASCEARLYKKSILELMQCACVGR